MQSIQLRTSDHVVEPASMFCIALEPSISNLFLLSIKDSRILFVTYGVSSMLPRPATAAVPDFGADDPRLDI